MTTGQIKWAQSHDWYIATLKADDGVLVRDEWIVMTEAPDARTGRHKLYSDSKAFTDYRALRDWAGY